MKRTVPWMVHRDRAVCSSAQKAPARGGRFTGRLSGLGKWQSGAIRGHGPLSLDQPLMSLWSAINPVSPTPRFPRRSRRRPVVARKHRRLLRYPGTSWRRQSLPRVRPIGQPRASRIVIGWPAQLGYSLILAKPLALAPTQGRPAFSAMRGNWTASRWHFDSGGLQFIRHALPGAQRNGREVWK